MVPRRFLPVKVSDIAIKIISLFLKFLIFNHLFKNKLGE